jgi:hypothetical protein
VTQALWLSKNATHTDRQTRRVANEKLGNTSPKTGIDCCSAQWRSRSTMSAFAGKADSKKTAGQSQKYALELNVTFGESGTRQAIE